MSQISVIWHRELYCSYRNKGSWDKIKCAGKDTDPFTRDGDLLLPKDAETPTSHSQLYVSKLRSRRKVCEVKQGPSIHNYVLQTPDQHQFVAIY